MCAPAAPPSPNPANLSDWASSVCSNSVRRVRAPPTVTACTTILGARTRQQQGRRSSVAQRCTVVACAALLDALPRRQHGAYSAFVATPSSYTTATWSSARRVPLPGAVPLPRYGLGTESAGAGPSPCMAAPPLAAHTADTALSPDAPIPPCLQPPSPALRPCRAHVASSRHVGVASSTGLQHCTAACAPRALPPGTRPLPTDPALGTNSHGAPRLATSPPPLCRTPP